MSDEANIPSGGTQRSDPPGNTRHPVLRGAGGPVQNLDRGTTLALTIQPHILPSAAHRHFKTADVAAYDHQDSGGARPVNALVTPFNKGSNQGNSVSSGKSQSLMGARRLEAHSAFLTGDHYTQDHAGVVSWCAPPGQAATSGGAVSWAAPPIATATPVINGVNQGISIRPGSNGAPTPVPNQVATSGGAVSWAAPPMAMATPVNNGVNQGISTRPGSRSAHRSGAPTPVQMKPRNMSSILHPPGAPTPVQMKPDNMSSISHPFKRDFQPEAAWFPVESSELLPTHRSGIDEFWAQRQLLLHPGISQHFVGAHNMSLTQGDSDVEQFEHILTDVYDRSEQFGRAKFLEKLQELCRQYKIFNKDGQPFKNIDDIQKVCFNGELCDDEYLTRYCQFSRCLFENDLSWVHEAEIEIMRTFHIQFGLSTHECKSFLMNIAFKSLKSLTDQRAKSAMVKKTGGCFYKRKPGDAHLKHTFGEFATTDVIKKMVQVGPNTISGTLVVLKNVTLDTQGLPEQISLALRTSFTRESFQEKMAHIWSNHANIDLQVGNNGSKNEYCTENEDCDGSYLCSASSGDEASVDEPSVGLSDYEKFRNEKVRRNEAHMKSLGLGFGLGLKVKTPSGKKKQGGKTDNAETNRLPARRSGRHAVVRVCQVDHSSLFPTLCYC